MAADDEGAAADDFNNDDDVTIISMIIISMINSSMINSSMINSSSTRRDIRVPPVRALSCWVETQTGLIVAFPPVLSFLT